MNKNRWPIWLTISGVALIALFWGIYAIWDPESRVLDTATRASLPGQFAQLTDGVTHYELSGPDGAPVTRFAIVHDRPLHLIVVRHDLTGFQHLHPTMAPDGTWSLPLTLPAPGRYRAYADFSALVELDPYYTDYLNERAKIARRRGDWDTALADYDRAIAMAPPFPELYYNRGTARAALRDVDGARADFGYVLEMEPGDLDTRLSRAELRLGAGDVAGAGEAAGDGDDGDRLVFGVAGRGCGLRVWRGAFGVRPKARPLSHGAGQGVWPLA